MGTQTVYSGVKKEGNIFKKAELTMGTAYILRGFNKITRCVVGRRRGRGQEGYIV